MEEVDVLTPPLFTPGGERMTATNAILAGKWLGSSNVWIYRTNQAGAIEFLYQEREPNSPWMPGKLDVAAGGYYKVGELKSPASRLKGALRELKEELGLKPRAERLKFITRRLNVGVSQKGNERKSCCDIYALEFKNIDEIALSANKETNILEAHAVYWLGLADLLSLYKNSKAKVIVTRIPFDGTASKKQVAQNNFCPNFDDYLFTMPVLITAIVGLDINYLSRQGYY